MAIADVRRVVVVGGGDRMLGVLELGLRTVMLAGALERSRCSLSRSEDCFANWMDATVAANEEGYWRGWEDEANTTAFVQKQAPRGAIQ